MKVKLLKHSELDMCDSAVGQCYAKGPYHEEEKIIKRIDNVGNVYKHSSILEFIDYNFEIEASTKVLLEISRHRQMSIACKCISGDSEITTSVGKQEIKELYRKQENLINLPKVRIYNENTKEFEFVKIIEIFETGIKKAYKLTTKKGKVITTSKDHRFLSNNKWVKLSDLKVGDNISINGQHLYKSKDWCFRQKYIHLNIGKGLKEISKNTGYTERLLRKAFNDHNLQYDDLEKSVIGSNNAKGGGFRLYKSKDWLLKQKYKYLAEGKGIRHIANDYYMNYNTLRSWFKKLNLQYSGKEKAMITFDNFNEFKNIDTSILKGRTRKRKNISIRQSASYFGEKIKNILIENGESCAKCGSFDNLEIDHIKQVKYHPELAEDKKNLQLLCNSCHKIKTSKENSILYKQKYHKNEYKISKRKFTIKEDVIISIEELKNIQMFDMEVSHLSHNYVANGILVHNSSRYTLDKTEVTFEKTGDKDIDLQLSKWKATIEDMIKSGKKNDIVSLMLPQAFLYKWQIKINARSLQNLFNLRLDKHAHFQIREVAIEMYKQLPENHKFLFKDIYEKHIK